MNSGIFYFLSIGLAVAFMVIALIKEGDKT
jgi:hypothetical protein